MGSRRVQLTALALLSGLTLAGCSSSTSGSGTHAPLTTSNTSPTTTAASTTSSPSTASTSASRSVGSGTTTASTTTTHAGMPLCLSNIRVIPGPTQGAAGHVALVLIFNNVSRTTTCEIIGYPGVDLVTSSGATVAHLTRTLRGMAGGEPSGVSAPQPVILTPGASASALAEASNVPQGGITDCGSYNLLVTVPNQFVSVPADPLKLPRCAAEIHPVVAGTRGGMH